MLRRYRVLIAANVLLVALFAVLTLWAPSYDRADEERSPPPLLPHPVILDIEDGNGHVVRRVFVPRDVQVEPLIIEVYCAVFRWPDGRTGRDPECPRYPFLKLKRGDQYVTIEGEGRVDEYRTDYDEDTGAFDFLFYGGFAVATPLPTQTPRPTPTLVPSPTPLPCPYKGQIRRLPGRECEPGEVTLPPS